MVEQQSQTYKIMINVDLLKVAITTKDSDKAYSLVGTITDILNHFEHDESFSKGLMEKYNLIKKNYNNLLFERLHRGLLMNGPIQERLLLKKCDDFVLFVEGYINGTNN